MINITEKYKKEERKIRTFGIDEEFEISNKNYLISTEGRNTLGVRLKSNGEYDLAGIEKTVHLYTYDVPELSKLVIGNGAYQLYNKTYIDELEIFGSCHIGTFEGGARNTLIHANDELSVHVLSMHSTPNRVRLEYNGEYIYEHLVGSSMVLLARGNVFYEIYGTSHIVTGGTAIAYFEMTMADRRLIQLFEGYHVSGSKVSILVRYDGSVEVKKSMRF